MGMCEAVLVILLSFNGELYLQKINDKPVSYPFEYDAIVEEWREKNTTHFWEIGGDFSKQGHYLNNAKGTMQGVDMRVIKDFWMSSYYSDKIAFYNELISFVFIVGASMTLAITAVDPDMRYIY